MPANTSQDQRTTNAPWTIVGAGPVGAMQTLYLTALFPNQKIYVLDKRDEYQRQYGLTIWRQTVDKMIDDLKNIKDQSSNVDSERINKVIKVLSDNLAVNRRSVFVKINELTSLLEDEASKLGAGNVEFKKAPEYEVNNEAVQQAQAGQLEGDTNAASILSRSKVIFGADGARSQFRQAVMPDQEQESAHQGTIQYLVQMKMTLKNNGRTSWLDTIKNSVLPTLFNRGRLHMYHRGKDKATVEFLTKAGDYAALTQNGKGNFKYPYTHPRELPANNDQLRKIRTLLNNALQHVGEQNLKEAHSENEESPIAITAIPLAYNEHKNLATVWQNKFVFLVGDAAISLPLYRGINQGFYSVSEYAKGMLKLDHQNQLNDINSDPDLEHVQENIDEIHNEAKRKIEAIKRQNFFIESLQGALELPSQTVRAKIPMLPRVTRKETPYQAAGKIYQACQAYETHLNHALEKEKDDTRKQVIRTKKQALYDIVEPLLAKGWGYIQGGEVSESEEIDEDQRNSAIDDMVQSTSNKLNDDLAFNPGLYTSMQQNEHHPLNQLRDKLNDHKETLKQHRDSLGWYVLKFITATLVSCGLYIPFALYRAASGKGISGVLNSRGSELFTSVNNVVKHVEQPHAPSIK